MYKNLTIAICIVVIIVLILNTCSHSSANHASVIDTTVVCDSQTHIDTIPFIDSIPVHFHVPIPGPAIIDSANDVKVYSDSTKNADIVIYWSDSIQGTLLAKHLSYKLFVPKQIEKTIIVDNSKTITVEKNTHKLYLETEFGTFDKNIGFDFIHKKNKLKAGYNYNFASKSHNLKIGVKIWQSK